ncbi:hypothetical protein [Pontibacter pamirensis]|uniref:hypothetical protein n=1 Tax=Pontibacter pamirensis TaxID=2562824 RepID=UPI00138A3013|nr:hypothetical protein [Pontibacter pamirensis]
MDASLIFDKDLIKILIPFISTVFAVILGAYQFTVTKHRNKIKLDLEILKLFGDVVSKDAPEYKKFENIMKKKISKAYRPNEERTDLDRSDLFWGVIALVTSIIFLDYIEEYPSKAIFFHYISIFALSILGMIGIYCGMERKFRYIRNKRKNLLAPSNSKAAAV